MKDKMNRLKVIKEIVSENNISNQDDLLKILKDRGFELTQATLSRDLKRLKITKIPIETGEYYYKVNTMISSSKKGEIKIIGSNSLEFSGHLAVLKTRSGYAGGIAAEIDNRASDAILGTIAGDDTILIIPREGFSRLEITKILSNVIENL
jgi:transcriptional regulator of arginine metabolism